MQDNVIAASESKLASTVLGANLLPSTGTFNEAVQAAGLDYQVEKVQAYQATPAGCVGCHGTGWDQRTGDPSTLCRTCDGLGIMQQYELAPDCHLVRRADNLAVLGHVGSRYQVQQNSEALEGIRPLLESGRATLEAAGLKGEGEQMWAMLQFNQAELLRTTNGAVEAMLGEAATHPYGLVILDHSGNQANVLTTLNVRLWCSNMLPGLRKRTSGWVKHTGDVQGKWDVVADDMYSTMVHQVVEFANQVETLRQYRLGEQAFANLVLDMVAPTGKRAELTDSNRTQASYARRIARRNNVSRLWREGAGHQGTQTAWEAYNGAIEALDHDPEFRKRTTADSDLNGSRTQLKRRLLAGLLEYAKQN